MQAVLRSCLKLDPGERSTAEAVHAGLLAVRAARSGRRHASTSEQHKPTELYEPPPSCCAIM